MRLLLLFARAFIDTFGITAPTRENERRVAWFIATLMFLVGVAVLGSFLVLHRLLRT